MMFYLVLFFTLFPSLAWAEPNVPTIFLTERLMLYSFVLIVGLEALVIHKYLSGINKKQSLIISLKANLLTILAVVPIVWGIWAFIRFHPIEFLVPFVEGNIWELIIISPWIDATQNLLIAEWIMAPVYFIASYYGEYWFSRKKLADYDKKIVKKAFFLANLYSYLMIMAFETIYQLSLAHYKELNPKLWYLW